MAEYCVVNDTGKDSEQMILARILADTDSYGVGR